VFPEDDDEEETTPESDDVSLSATTPARLPRAVPLSRPELGFAR